jgi:chromosome segregation ATPase
MTEQTKEPSPNIHSRIGAVEARMQSVESRLDKHDTQINALEKGDAAMLSKLAENDSRWQQIQQQLQVVEQIQDIQKTMANIGKIIKAGALAIKWCLLTASLISGVHLAVKAGDLSALQSFINAIIGM